MENNLSKKNVTTGSDAVKLFIEIYKCMYPDKECYQTELGGDDDALRHIDVYAGGKTHDIKNNMTYDDHGRLCIPVELKNNWGGKGSLYGEQDYITYKYSDHNKLFYSYSRERLIEHIEKYAVKGKTGKFVLLTRPHNYAYLGYRRWNEGKKDFVILIPIEDINPDLSFY